MDLRGWIFSRAKITKQCSLQLWEKSRKLIQNGTDCQWLESTYLKPLKKYAKIVQQRAEISGGNPIIDPIRCVYLKNNSNRFAGTQSITLSDQALWG